jgi:prepilin-type N-terminal cleavage/methylation domain-containing protein
MRIRNNKAFTLIEMIIVIVIIGILAAIVVPQFMSIRDTAINAALESSVNHIYSYMAALQGLDDFDDEHYFTYKKNQSSGGEEYLSRYLEVEWEQLNGAGDDDNANLLNTANPVSNKKGIVNWNNPTSLSALYQNQAIYITNSSTASYTVDSPKTVNDCYEGAIIIWYDDSYASNIYIYYVDSDGLQSDSYRVIER